MSERDKLTLARISWVQSLLSHRIVAVSFAKHLYQRCCSAVHTAYDESSYRSMLDDASKHLSVLDLDLRNFRDQQSGQPVIAIVNTKADQLIQGATRYSASEIVVIKKIVEEIFKARKEAYSIPALEAVTLGARSKSNLTRDAVEELLKNLVDHRWLDYSSEGIYTLSTRSLLELRNYLQNEVGEEYYHTCTHCKDLVTLGLGCSHSPRSCDVRYHLHCARSTIGSRVDDDDALLRLQGFPCPGCRKPWKSRPIGPKALNLATGDQDMEHSQAGPSRSSRRRRAAHDEENDEEEDEEEDFHDTQQHGAEDDEEEEEEEPTQRRSSRVKPEPQQEDSTIRGSSSDELEESAETEQVRRPLKRRR